MTFPSKWGAACTAVGRCARFRYRSWSSGPCRAGKPRRPGQTVSPDATGVISHSRVPCYKYALETRWTAMENLQQHRRTNLRGLLLELASEGLRGLDAQAAFFTTRSGTLKGMLEHGFITAPFARNVEWAMQRRDGWLDEDHGADPF